VEIGSLLAVLGVVEGFVSILEVAIMYYALFGHTAFILFGKSGIALLLACVDNILAMTRLHLSSRSIFRSMSMQVKINWILYIE
jgi:hypothetical protein